MPKEKDISFLSIIIETFGPVFEDYGFEFPNQAKWNDSGEYVVTTQKGDVALNFYLGVSPHLYYCSTGIKLSGELGERATSDPKFRNMGVSTIAECLDPEYQPSRGSAQTSEEVRRNY